MRRVVVVGNGMAGARVVDELLRRDDSLRITVGLIHGNADDGGVAPRGNNFTQFRIRGRTAVVHLDQKAAQRGVIRRLQINLLAGCQNHLTFFSLDFPTIFDGWREQPNRSIAADDNSRSEQRR